MFLHQSRAAAIMEKYGLDGLVATTPENVAYLTGFWTITSLRHRARQLYAVLRKKEAVPDVIVSRGMVDHFLQEKFWVRQYYIYGDFYFAFQSNNKMDKESEDIFHTLENLSNHANGLDALIHCLKENDLSQGCIGVDQGSDILFLAEALEKKLPGLKTNPAYDIFREIRACKTPDEIERIRGSVEICEKALMGAIQGIGKGVTEKEIARAFRDKVMREGALPTIEFVGSGPRGAFPSVEPSERQVRKGDLVRFDVGCLWDAYHSDIARTAVLGPPSSKQQTYHDALMAGQGRILSALKPGVAIADLFQMGMEETRRRGIRHYQRHHLGHGNGLEGYEHPLVSPGSSMKLEPGMVICIESPYYEPGFGGIQIEDIVEITEDGYRRLTQIERKLFVI